MTLHCVMSSRVIKQPFKSNLQINYSVFLLLFLFVSNTTGGLLLSGKIKTITTVHHDLQRNIPHQIFSIAR